MKKLFFAAVLFFAIGCSSGKSKDSASDSAAPVGNSDGVNTIGTDTSHMDTSSHSISTDH